MESFLKEYLLEIKTLSPVFIGSGASVNKKEYLYDRQTNRIILFDTKKLFAGLTKYNLLAAYEEHLLKGYEDLFAFMRNNKISRREYEPWILYQVPVGDRGLINRSTKEIFTFIKDPYGLPYIPGSSLKGAFRTILQCSYFMDNTEKAEEAAHKVLRAPTASRKWYMKAEDTFLDVESMHRRLYNEISVSDQNNDTLRGLIIGDSEPLSLDSLCICQKIDMSVNGDPKPMPLLRECLKPGTTVRFHVTIDQSVCDLTAKKIGSAVKQFYENYRTEFMEKFDGAQKTGDYTFFLGGGAGYVSKTCTYAVMHGNQAVKTVSKIIDETLPKSVQSKHMHRLDSQKGVSPHALKTTKYDGKSYQMGACTIRKFNAVKAADQQ